MSEPIVNVSNLIFRYGGTEVLHSISFRLNKGEIIGLLGPNGAGKSTTIKIIAGIMAQTSGHVSVCGFSLPESAITVIFLLFSVAASSIYLTFGLRVIEGIPFGKQTGSDMAVGGGGGRMLIFVFAAFAAVGIQYLLFRSAIAVAIATVVLGAAGYTLTRWSLHSFEAAIRHHLGATSQTSTMIYTEVEPG